MISQMTSNFSQIQPLTAELSAIDCVKNLYFCCGHSSAFIFIRIFFILGNNKDISNISDEFEFRPDQTSDCVVICP